MSNWWHWLPFTLGAAALVGVSANIDPDSWHAVTEISLGLVLVAIVSHYLAICVDGIALAALFSTRGRVNILVAAAACWVSQSVGRLLPATQIGGEVAKIRVLLLGGVPPLTATAACIADAMLGLLTLIPFLAVGLAVLASITDVGLDFSWTVALAALVLLVATIAAVRPQRTGRLVNAAVAVLRLLRFEALAIRMERLGSVTRRFDVAVDRLLKRRDRWLASAAWRFAGWFVGALEVWAVLCLIGEPVDVATALALDAAIQASRAVAFFIPAAIGAQEAGILLFASLVGLPQPAAVVFALVRRVREISVGLGGIGWWQFREFRHERRLFPFFGKKPRDSSVTII